MYTAKVTTVLLIAAFSVLLFVNHANALKYAIDGDISDWGIDLSSAMSRYYLDNNKPSLPEENIFTEDNDDTSGDSRQVGPGYSSGNEYDAEAIYFDNDDQYGYIAIITGMPKDGWYHYPWHFGPGDIGIDVDGANDIAVVDEYYNQNSSYSANTPYEYAITMGGELVKVTKWNSVLYTNFGYDISGPYRVNETDDTFSANNISFAYSDSPINAHYVIEAAFLLSDLGLESGDTFQINWTMGCGNDYVRLEGARVHTPEPATLLLFGSGLIGLASVAGKKAKKERKA